MLATLWQRIPMALRVAVLALLGVILLFALWRSWDALLGLLLGLFGGASPKAQDSQKETRETIARREKYEQLQAQIQAQAERQQARVEAKKREQEQSEKAEDTATEKAAAEMPEGALRERILGALEGAEKSAKALLPLLFFVAALASCVAPRGTGDSMPTSRPVCFSAEEGRRIYAALEKCSRLPARCIGRCSLEVEKERASCQAGLRASGASLQLCRAERDAALSRTCPACPKCGSVALPVALGVIGGVVVGVGVGIGVGWALSLPRDSRVHLLHRGEPSLQ